MLKRLLRWLLITGASLVVLVALFYVEENWRGKHAWEKYKREREAKGDHFEWSAIVPPPVPDDQNFAMTPLFAELFPKRPEHPRLEAVKLPDCPKAAGNWHEGRIENLAAWQECFTNEDLLAALSKYDLILREVTEASRRPSCRFPIRYEDHFNALLPHLGPLRNLARLYRLRALAELAAGQSEAALVNVRVCLRLADMIKDEPTMISFLVHVAMLDLATQSVWEGLARHNWSEAELATLQTEFGEVDMFAHYVGAIHGERLCAQEVIRLLRENPHKLDPELFEDRGAPYRMGPISGWLYHGWLYQNGLAMDRFHTEMLLPALDAKHQRIDPRLLTRLEAELDQSRTTPYNFFCKMFSQSIFPTARKIALSQTGVNEATLACALERYRLAHGQLPEALGALVPQFLSKIPHDVIDGQPLRYRRTAVDQYVLYSIGWNERDDDGQITWTKDKPSRQDLAQGDWVWFSQPQPQPAPSEQK